MLGIVSWANVPVVSSMASTKVAFDVQSRPKKPARKYSAELVMRSWVVDLAMIFDPSFGYRCPYIY